MTEPYYADDTVTVYAGDCLDVLAELPDASVDAVCTDPPYGIRFMGQAWDGLDIERGIETRRGQAPMPEDGKAGRNGGYRSAAAEAGRYDLSLTANQAFQLWCEQWATECLRILKPGGMIVCFGGTRTYHRLACAIEDAGFEIRDSLAWLHGQGFPKSRNVTLDLESLPTCSCGAGAEVTDDRGGIVDPAGPSSQVGTRSRAEAAAATPAGVSTDRTVGVRPQVVPPGASGESAAISDGHTGTGAVDASVGPATELVATDHTSVDSIAGALHDPKSTAERPVRCEACAGMRGPIPQGLGTALKPAFDPIVVARKPLSGTVAANVVQHGTGALNVDATRIGATVWEPAKNLCGSCAAAADQSKRPTAPARRASTAAKPAAVSRNGRGATNPADISKAATGCSDGTRAVERSTSSNTGPCGSNTTPPSPPATSSTTSTRTSSTTGSRICNSCSAPITTPTTTSGSSAGRWPSNVVLDEHQAAALDQQSGESVSPAKVTQGGRKINGGRYNSTGEDSPIRHAVVSGPGDSGGASRFFYTAKADAAERIRVPSDELCELHGVKRCTICLTKPVAHPTVKPLSLMRWLVRLVTPPGGTVLDPFAGSGTTAEACILERFRCIAIERETDYLPLITQRINRRRDPAAYVKASGEDGGLFDLLDGAS